MAALKSLRRKLRGTSLIPWLAATLIRIICRTLRFEVTDLAGILAEGKEPVIWLFWHNRLFVMPAFHGRYLPTRTVTVLTSPSGDGEIIARTMAKFGLGAIRGSSNKRPAAAMREMARRLRDGCDLAITPDGPRGPRYVLQPGAVKLAQLTDCALLPVNVRYSRAIALRGWDGFLIPWPFSRVHMTLRPLQTIWLTDSDEAFENERRRVQDLLLQDIDA